RRAGQRARRPAARTFARARSPGSCAPDSGWLRWPETVPCPSRPRARRDDRYRKRWPSREALGRDAARGRAGRPRHRWSVASGTSWVGGICLGRRVRRAHGGTGGSRRVHALLARTFCWGSDHHTDHLAVKYHVRFHEALDLEDRLAAVQPDALADQHQAVAGADLAAKANFLHSAEADKTDLEQSRGLAVIARELGGGLAYEDAGHERVIGHVAPDPELVGRDVLVADDQLVLPVDQHDRGQLLHLEALWVVTIDSFPVGEDTRRVDRGGVDQGDWRHAQNILSDHQRNSVPARHWLDRRFAGSAVDSRGLVEELRGRWCARHGGKR